MLPCVLSGDLDSTPVVASCSCYHLTVLAVSSSRVVCMENRAGLPEVLLGFGIGCVQMLTAELAKVHYSTSALALMNVLC